MKTADTSDASNTGRRRTGAAAAACLAAISIAAAAAPAGAAECRFETAVYAQPESSYVLRFRPSRTLGRFPGTTNFFYVESKDFDRPLEAWVIWNNGESRPNGSVMRDCPPDGMTNDDYAECTKWEGVMYSLTGGGAELLPQESEAPPATILLPDFGRRIRYSIVSDLGSEDVPWDVFRFQGCGAP